MNEFGVPVGYVWIIAAIAGVLFGLIARANGRSVAGYAIMAAITALLVAGIVFGIAHALTVPYTESEGRRLGTYATIITGLVIAASAGLAWLYSRSRVG